MPYILDKIHEAEKKNDRDECDILFIDDFNLDWDKWTEQSMLYSMWFDKWLCTDTDVGGKILFFGTSPFALSYQSGRKAKTTIVIFDSLIAEQVKLFMQTMLMPVEVSDEYETVDMMHFSENDLEKLVF